MWLFEYRYYYYYTILLVIHVCSSTTVLCSSHNAECIVCHFMFPITELYCNLWINSPPDALLHLELRIYTVVTEFALLELGH